MPPRHHRTVDRVAEILELVAGARRGIGLVPLAAALEAPKSSVHQLVNGLLARGYLLEQSHRYFLGPAPYVLTLSANPVAAQLVDHHFLERVAAAVRTTVLVGIQVGDSLVYIDHVGDDPAVDFTARTHAHRSLYATASGKILLAQLPARDLDGMVLAATGDDGAAARALLQELPEIRRTGLAYNLAGTVPDVYSVATALLGPQGTFVGALCAIGREAVQPRLPAIGRRMQRLVREGLVDHGV